MENGKSGWKTRVTQGTCPAFGAPRLQYVPQGVQPCFHYERNWTSSPEAVGLSLGPTVFSLGDLGHHFCHLCNGRTELFAGEVIVCSSHRHTFSQSGETQILPPAWSLETSQRFHLGRNRRSGDGFQRWRKSWLVGVGDTTRSLCFMGF